MRRCALPDWRDDVCAAVEAWIKADGGDTGEQRPRPGRPHLTKVGPARPEPDLGWYAVDLRNTSFNPDRAEGLRLAGRTPPQPGQGHVPLDIVFDGRRLRVRVAEFVKLDDAYLWQQRQPATYLLTQLRDGLRTIGDSGLAHNLVAGRLAAAPSEEIDLAGFTPAQREAYASCLTPGVRLVWGPPGTGKTRVLSEAISALTAAGRRVLLVSATNVAVDNALTGVLRHRRHQPGQILRVGPPHLREIATDPDISLTNLVRARLTEVEQRRDHLTRQLLVLRRRADDLATATAALAGFDPAEHARQRTLIETTDQIPQLTEAVHQAAQQHQRGQAALAHADDLVGAAQAAVTETHETIQCLGRIADLRREWAATQAAADQISVTAMTARAEADRITAELHAAQAGSKLQRWRNRHTIAALEDRERTQLADAHAAERRDQQNRELLNRVHATITAQITQLKARVRYTDEQIGQRHAALEKAQTYRSTTAGRLARLDERLKASRAELAAAEATPRPSDADRVAVERATRDDLPGRHAQLVVMRAEAAGADTQRQRLEQQHAEVQEEFERLSRDAEAALIKQATVIATTLARLRTRKALIEGPYDVVLIDEVSAATIPEILLAVSLAHTTAVLLGDFLQLGAVITGPINDNKDPQIRRWLFRDIFALCGITIAADARAHPGCTTLDVQHRFGPQIMGLANTVAYDGQLTAGARIRDHDADDPEIVLIDTDDIDDLAEVRAAGPKSGWWPIGVLTARVLADYHHTRDEDLGVITPYKLQAETTLEAFRDLEHGGNNPTDVGTAHRFQGREFSIVVFDLVEDGITPRWMAAAGPNQGAFGREGLRLFTVAITRARHRLYLIGSRNAIIGAAPGTALAAVAALEKIRTIPARQLIGLPPAPNDKRTSAGLGTVGQELAEILAQHVRITAIHDEREFYANYTTHLSSAKQTLWLWAPWTGKRLERVLPALSAAATLGVKIVVFVRDPSDDLQGRTSLQQQLKALRAVVPTVVEVYKLHQKIVVIDERLVLLGSLNTLSWRDTREVMLVMEGEYFARKLLKHEQAHAMARPPRCGQCGATTIALRRTVRQGWYWRCYAPTGDTGGDGEPTPCGWTTPMEKSRDPR
ncbi:AAA domain-containing protein [Krasilnikovia sp. MM14-A1004]|uniref:AAA domain-containing protein n=1 Tax=Krasilnikovia sp. MM14-A1004 TaxID=3373541 RepID=UPI00399D25BB